MQDLRGAEEAAGGEALGWRGSHHDTLPADAGRRVDRRLDILDRQTPPRRAADEPGLRRRRRPAGDSPARPQARSRPGAAETCPPGLALRAEERRVGEEWVRT